MGLNLVTSSGTRKRLRRRWGKTMATGKLSGDSGMNLFVNLYDNSTESSINAYHNARDSGILKYEFNPNLWCYELLPKLTCLVIHKDDCGTGQGLSGQAWRARYGGVAITKRHVLYCGHAFTHAAGTWSVNPAITDPTRLRFIDLSGNTIDRVQIHQCTAYTSENNEANNNGLNYADITVAVLDLDLPDTILIPKIIPSDYNYELSLYDRLALSQEWQPQHGVEPLSSNLGYPSRNRQMVWRRELSPSYSETYNVWSGDSGTPSFIMLNGELVVAGLVGADDFQSYPTNGWTLASRINKLIELADENAISIGRMATPTGYTVQEAVFNQ